jgi:outer membrane protein TolC
VAYEASNIPVGDFDFNSTALSGHQLGLKQKLPFPGVLANRELAARAASGAAQWQLEDRRLRISAGVERAWAELGFAQRAISITDRNIDFLRQLTRIAETKYSVGSGLQQDVLRAQVELTRLLDERLSRVAAIARAEAALAALLDLPPEVKLPATSSLADESPLPALDDLLSRIEGRSPLLRGLADSVEEAERLERVAKFEGYPDFDLGFGYRVRQNAGCDPVNGDDFVSAGVTIRLPVNRRKWRARVAETEALTRRARAEYRTVLAALRDALRSRFADLQRADSEVDLVGAGLIPQARQSLVSSRSGYQVDKVDFLSLIDSQVSLLDAELSLERAWADRRTAYAAVEAEVGEMLR